jgi:hypothetical protein
LVAIICGKSNVISSVAIYLRIHAQGFVPRQLLTRMAGRMLRQSDYLATAVPSPTNVPWAPVPTFQLPNVTITPEDLNRHLNNELRKSKFTRAFVDNMLCHTVYEWQSVTGWRCIHENPATPAATGAELWFKRYLADPEICKDPKGWALREAERVMNELRGGGKDRSQG